jgi:hypothetical protein
LEGKEENNLDCTYQVDEAIKRIMLKCFSFQGGENEYLKRYPVPSGFDFSTPVQPDFLLSRMSKGYKRIDRELKDAHRKSMEVTCAVIFALRLIREQGEKCSIDDVEGILADILSLSFNSTAAISKSRKFISSKSIASFLGSVAKEPTNVLFNDRDIQQMERIIKIEESMNRAESRKK